MSTSDLNHVAKYITALSSTTLRAFAFIFLRWVSYRMIFLAPNVNIRLTFIT
jgi:hypothetical protein